jgi:hypothetical protein
MTFEVVRGRRTRRGRHAPEVVLRVVRGRGSREESAGRWWPRDVLDSAKGAAAVVLVVTLLLIALLFARLRDAWTT